MQKNPQNLLWKTLKSRMITVRSKRYQVHVVVFFICLQSVPAVSLVIKVNRYECSCSNCNAQISVYCCLKLTMVLIDYLFKLASEILMHEFFENIFIFNKECIIWCPSLSDSQYSKTYYLYHQSYHTPCKCWILMMVTQEIDFP